MTPVDVLLYVEDPGAVNYLGGVPDLLAKFHCSGCLLAAGSALKYLGERGIPFQPVSTAAHAEELLRSFMPRLVIVGTSENPDTLGLRLIEAARSLGIPSAGAVDAWANAEFRFRGRSRSPLAYAPDWLALPDESTRKAFVDLGFPSQRIVVAGHPHYDRVREVGKQLSAIGSDALRERLLPEVPPDCRVVVFLGEISEGLNTEQYRRSSEYTLHGRGTSQDRTVIVMEEFLDALSCVEPRPYTVLRLHPKNSPSDFGSLISEFDSISVGGNPLEIVYIADLVVGMSTVLMMEAALMRRPTMSILPREREKQWLASIEMGITPCATDRDEVRRLLSQMLCLQDQEVPRNEVPELLVDAEKTLSAFLYTRLQEIAGCPASPASDPEG